MADFHFYTSWYQVHPPWVLPDWNQHLLVSNHVASTHWQISLRTWSDSCGTTWVLSQVTTIRLLGIPIETNIISFLLIPAAPPRYTATIVQYFAEACDNKIHHGSHGLGTAWEAWSEGSPVLQINSHSGLEVDAPHGCPWEQWHSWCHTMATCERAVTE